MLRLTKKQAENLALVANNVNDMVALPDSHDWYYEHPVAKILPQEQAREDANWKYNAPVKHWLNPTLLVRKGGKFPEVVETSACFARFFGDKLPSILKDEKVRCLALLMDKANNNQFRFVHYILNESPYKDAFITKSAGNALRQGYVLVSVDVPANMTVGGMIALRWGCWERPTVSATFNDLVAAGVDKDVAFLACHGYCFSFGRLVFNSVNNHHSPLDNSLSKRISADTIREFKDGKFLWSNKTLRQRPCSVVWDTYRSLPTGSTVPPREAMAHFLKLSEEYK